MGEISDLIIEGILCEICGVVVNTEPVGYPVRCDNCLQERLEMPKGSHSLLNVDAVKKGDC